jgi:CHAT domain-containing protein
MSSSLKSEEIREYLLGRVSDETTLEGIEELLFTDAEFCSQVELMEDGIINDYVLGRLDDADAASFRATLSADPERRARVELTEALRAKALTRSSKVQPSFFASLRAFFRQPVYAGAFAALLIAAVVLTVYLTRKSNPDQLAELRSIYHQARPTETRISEFGYAPLTQLRGAPEPVDQKRLRRIENNLIDAAEQTPNAQTFHASGIFNLTQHKYADAIKDFERSLKFADKNAKVHNDLGVAYFELSKTASAGEKSLALLKSLDEFTTATEIDGNLLEALFNKSLALQALKMPHKARESWTLYLQKDPSSPWAAEARKNLAQVESEQTRLKKTDEQVLSDFLAAFRNHEETRVQQIHNDTKGLLRGTTVPLQLSRRYLLAKQSGANAEAAEIIAALSYIGNFEQEQNGESFFLALAKFYAQVDTDKIERLLQAKETFARGLQSLETDPGKAISELESSRDLFALQGDECESAIAEIRAAQLLPDVAEVAGSRARLSAVIANARSRKFAVLLPPAYYSLGMGDYHQNRLSESAKNLKTALQLAEAGNNTFEVQHAQDALALNYANIGELEPALVYAGKVLSEDAPYFESLNQFLRNKGTLALVSLKLKCFWTSLSLAREHLSITQENWPDSHRVNDSLQRLITAASAQGDLNTALTYTNESMRIALARAPTAENTNTTAKTYLQLADLEGRTKDCDGALTDYDKALELYGRLPEVTDNLYQIHKGKLFCFQQLDRQEGFSNELKIVWKLSEDYRTTVREDESRQAFFENEQGVFDAATANALKKQDIHEAFEFVEAAKARSLLEFVKADKPIAAVEKDYAAVVKPLSLAEIQTRLPDQLQLVQYAVLPDKLAIWTVSKTHFDLVEKQITAADLEDKVGAYQALIMEKAQPAELKIAAQDLFDLLIPPGLTTDKQLCLIPDKSLHQLAFATLVSHDGKYLLEKYAVFYAPSASVLVFATENARRKEQMKDERLLSIGNPDFDREENPNLPDLKSAEVEAREIAAGYQQSIDLLGGQATKERFLQNLTHVEVLHFAGHFLANRQSPGNSKLLFAGGDLRSSALAAYKLPLAKLVVLSACETGFERYNKSEGAIGIARTFLALGAPVVVASQWQVDSEVTKDLMISFHHNRKEKRMTSAESLRQSQLEVLNRNETRAPFYWAAFSLFGGYANY